MEKGKYILGFQESKLDDKNRFIVPKFTGFGPGTKLAFLDYNTTTFIGVEEYAAIEQRIERMLNAKKRAVKEEDYITLEDQINELLVQMMYVQGTEVLDSQRRMVIPKPIIKRFQSDEKLILCQGYITGFAIFFNEEDFQKRHEVNSKILNIKLS